MVLVATVGSAHAWRPGQNKNSPELIEILIQEQMHRQAGASLLLLKKHSDRILFACFMYAEPRLLHRYFGLGKYSDMPGPYVCVGSCFSFNRDNRLGKDRFHNGTLSMTRSIEGQ